MIQSPKMLSIFLGYSVTELEEILEWLNNETLSSKLYYSYRKRKNNGKFRTISPSCSRLKDIHNRLQSRVFSHVIFPYTATGSLKKRSGAINAKLHSGKKFHLQTDLLGFFDFVTNRKVYYSLLALNFSADVASMITKLTTYKGHLPQGAPTSSFLANLVGLTIDDGFLKLCESEKLTYSRYVDDITFSSGNDFSSTVPELLSKILETGFFYSNRKTVYKAGDIQVTGARVGCLGLRGTEGQFANLKSVFRNDLSKKGIENYLNYVKSINDSFTIKDYRKAFAKLQYPDKLYPQMNYGSSKVSSK